MNLFPSWAILAVNSLLQALKERDPYTYGHCKRVAAYSKRLAEAAGLNEQDQCITEYASIFHDLGKIGIPDSILLKASRLTREEEEIMKAHPIKSEEIVKPLASIPFFNSLLPGIRHHHERIDGKGYPDGCCGDHIPLHARIILISDTFDAMTTTRPYRKGLTHEIAYKELKQFSGRQFDPQLVKVFLKAHPKWLINEEEVTRELGEIKIKKAA